MSHEDDRGFDSPEEAALSGWDPEWNARVLRVEIETADSVYVFIETEPSHPMRVHCQRMNGRWEWTSDSSA
ncbi:MAG TPA: hypothetical protein VM287_10910 [Egibacteraceae bacterium]|jgi:hypothetical protein|nr:hypothetical protein [Egibacteraceae bacterium]